MSVADSNARTRTVDKAWFATTHWAVVRTAAETGSPRAGEALENLCRSYWQPIYVYVRRQGYSPEDAEDLTQAFFTRLLAHEFLRNVAREKGTFRSFLLRSLTNFLINERARATRRKRGGGRTFVSWEEWTAESSDELEPLANQTPERNYDQRWALTLFDHALARLRAEYLVSAKPELFNHLKRFLMTEAAPGEYATAGQSLGMTSNAVAVTVHRLRQRYRQLLREEVAHTVTDPGEVEAELRYLVTLLSG